MSTAVCMVISVGVYVILSGVTAVVVHRRAADVVTAEAERNILSGGTLRTLWMVFIWASLLWFSLVAGYGRGRDGLWLLPILSSTPGGIALRFAIVRAYRRSRRYRREHEWWTPEFQARVVAQMLPREAEDQTVPVGQPRRLPDGTVCNHDGETDNYCTRCWAPLKPGVGP